MIGILSLIVLVGTLALLKTLVQIENRNMQEKLENWDTADAAGELHAIHQNLFRKESEWREVLERDGISVSTTFTQENLVGKRIRTYRTLSRLHASEISVDRILELLDGGFLEEEVWFKDDFKGGARVREYSIPGLVSSWVPQYISDLRFPPFRLRDFVYLLMRKELEPRDFARVTTKPIERQALIGYRSISEPSLRSDLVRAQQFPSLDRITLCEDGEIIWEHIMVFHLGGAFPLLLTNAMAKPAAHVLWHEAVNMRKHITRRKLSDAA